MLPPEYVMSFVFILIKCIKDGDCSPSCGPFEEPAAVNGRTEAMEGSSTELVRTRDLAQVAKCHATVCPFSSLGQSRTSTLSEP